MNSEFCLLLTYVFTFWQSYYIINIQNIPSSILIFAFSSDIICVCMDHGLYPHLMRLKNVHTYLIKNTYYLNYNVWENLKINPRCPFFLIINVSVFVQWVRQNKMNELWIQIGTWFHGFFYFPIRWLLLLFVVQGCVNNLKKFRGLESKHNKPFPKTFHFRLVEMKVKISKSVRAFSEKNGNNYR